MKSKLLNTMSPLRTFIVMAICGAIVITAAFVVVPKAAAATNACVLLTRAEAKQVLGAPIQYVTSSKDEFISISRECRYVAVLSTQGGSIEVYVYDDATVRSDKDSLFKSAADFFHRNMHALHAAGVTLVDMPDIGKSAYWEPAPIPCMSLTVAYTSRSGWIPTCT